MAHLKHFPEIEVTLRYFDKTGKEVSEEEYLRLLREQRLESELKKQSA